MLSMYPTHIGCTRKRVLPWTILLLLEIEVSLSGKSGTKVGVYENSVKKTVKFRVIIVCF